MEDRKKAVSPAPHKITFDERKSGCITGVTDVISFDEKIVCLKTTAGKMTIQGSGLTLTRLDLELGETDISGTVDGISYSKIGGEKRNRSRRICMGGFIGK